MGSNLLQHPISPAVVSSRSFYKIIFPFIIYDQKLRIPEEFSKKYGNELSTSVTLTVRNGQVSHVGVEKADKMLWFTDGWKEFSENHSISCGFFVVFNYEGNSKFNVLIFDLTATEIYNPRNTVPISKEPSKRKRCPLSNKGERGGNEFGTVAYRSYQYEKRFVKEVQHKKSDQVLVKEAIQMRKDGQQLNLKRGDEEELLGANHSRNISTIPGVMTQESENAVSVATMLKTNNPSFTKIMRPYNVHQKFVLNVPAIFSRKYLHGVSDSIYLQISDVEQWKVRCVRTDTGIIQCFSGGWSKFSKDNNLLEDDVCVFELIQANGVVLKVSIFHAR